MQSEKLLSLLKDLGINFQKFDHKAVFTCEESEGLPFQIPGAHTKQLLMKGKRKGKLILAIVMHDKRVDTKVLAKELGDQGLSFASPELLMEKMQLTPGSVTPFGLIHDKAQEIDVIIDEDAWNVDLFRFHPMINTATLSIDQEALKKFLAHTGHGFRVLKIPST